MDRHGRTGLEMAHRLNEDYFTIHSGKKKKRPVSEVGGGGYGATSLGRTTTATTAREEEEVPIEEIADVPALMHALRVAIVDREKVDALDRFVEEGGEELFYLDEKVVPLYAYPQITISFPLDIYLPADTDYCYNCSDPRNHVYVRLPSLSLALRDPPHRRRRVPLPATLLSQRQRSHRVAAQTESSPKGH